MGGNPFVFGIGFFLLALLRGGGRMFQGIENTTAFILLSGALGLGVRAFYPFAQDILSGVFWPHWLRVWRISVLEGRLRTAETLVRQPAQSALTKAGWNQARARRYILLFPFDQSGTRTVVAPTIVGNIAASLASSLFVQYGLAYSQALTFERHILFVIQRLWFSLDKQIRQDVSDASAVADALIGSLVALVFGVLAFLVYFLLEYLRGRTEGLLLLIAVLLVLLVWFSYSLLARETVGVVVTFEALLGRVSPAVLEQMIGLAREIAVAPERVFERIWGFIYRSQIAILEHLSRSPDGSVRWRDLLDSFYQPVVVQYPGFASYAFSEYMNFLASNGLVTWDSRVDTANPPVAITPIGRQFLAYMVARGYTREMRVN
jgi:hypothetical protein